MKIVDAAKLTDITRIIFLTVMLAYMALLFIRFIKVYLSVVMMSVISFSAIFYCYNARKRVVNRIVHDCKNAVHRTNPDSRAGLSGK
ncbi:MAG: hypothetical protein EOP54_06580 [Sphingobacteriales bacterium]|nr:MAG: hypothetical protein EOP54_06580 [Sphingobacteriales bacterium]